MILGSHRKTSLFSDATQLLHQVEADSETETATVVVQLQWEVKQRYLLRGWVYRWAGLSFLTCPRGDSAASMRYLQTSQPSSNRRAGKRVYSFSDSLPILLLFIGTDLYLHFVVHLFRIDGRYPEQGASLRCLPYFYVSGPRALASSLLSLLERHPEVLPTAHGFS